MQRYLLSRALSTLPVIFVVSAIAFLLMQMLPGDPVEALYPITDTSLTTQQRAELVQQTRERYGLDAPVPVQYAKWMGLVLRGDLGKSLRTREPVATMIKDRIGVTTQLAVMSMLIAIFVAIPVGMVAALHRNSPLDVIVSTVSMVGVAIPHFFFGMILILLFSYELHWLPAPGNFVGIQDDPIRSLQLTILPAVTLGLGSAAFLARLVRSTLLEVLAQDYMRTARAKGLRQRVIITRHALRNSMLPVVTVMGLQVITLLGGTVIIEQIFALPGLGRMVLAAIRSFDFPVIQGFVLFIGVVAVLANLVVDVVYAALDPRIHFS